MLLILIFLLSLTRDTCPNRGFTCTCDFVSFLKTFTSFIGSNSFCTSVLIVNLSQGFCLLSYCLSFSLCPSPALSQVSVWPYCWRCVVVLHSDHHFILYGQSGCFPDCGKNGVAYRGCRRPGQADWYRLRNTRLRFHQRVLQGKTAIKIYCQM